jgi:hypothetical protein
MSDQDVALSPLGAPPIAVPASGRRPFGRMILEVRLDMPAWKQVVAVACSILIGMFISAVILVASGVPPGDLVNEFASNVFDRQSFQAVRRRSSLSASPPRSAFVPDFGTSASRARWCGAASRRRRSRSTTSARKACDYR